MNLDQLDQKLWVALACPITGLEFDIKTASLIDTDKDWAHSRTGTHCRSQMGRLHAQESRYPGAGRRFDPARDH